MTSPSRRTKHYLTPPVQEAWRNKTVAIILCETVSVRYSRELPEVTCRKCRALLRGLGLVETRRWPT